MTDAPIRVFHWLFALSFTGAWLTAESERWRGVHVTLGYAFAGLLVCRALYGVIGPRQARLSLSWRRVSGLAAWWHGARSGRFDLSRLAVLGMALAMLLVLLVAGPLALSGYAGYMDWLGMEDALSELHEALANAALMLVLIHVVLIVMLSALRGRNLARPMLTGREPQGGASAAPPQRRWLALLLLAGYVSGVVYLGGADPVWSAAAHHQAGPHPDHDDEDDDD